MTAKAVLAAVGRIRLGGVPAGLADSLMGCGKWVRRIELVASASRSDEEAAGAAVTEPPHDRPWGIYSGYFHDPDGHLWEVIWNPALDLGSS
jgi:catechol 2,3-dioxygenase-like lactoylglutathione lyase family enzyme